MKNKFCLNKANAQKSSWNSKYENTKFLYVKAVECEAMFLNLNYELTSSDKNQYAINIAKTFLTINDIDNGIYAFNPSSYDSIDLIEGNKGNKDDNNDFFHDSTKSNFSQSGKSLCYEDSLFCESTNESLLYNSTECVFCESYKSTFSY